MTENEPKTQKNFFEKHTKSALLWQETEQTPLYKVFDFLPKNKFDDSHINDLMSLTDQEIAPILPMLLTWIQDCNWPVSKKMLPVLASHQALLVPLILNLLSPGENDEIWKYWILTRLMPLFSQENLQPILPSVRRIADCPTQNEKEEMVEEAAILFLRQYEESASAFGKL